MYMVLELPSGEQNKYLQLQLVGVRSFVSSQISSIVSV